MITEFLVSPPALIGGAVILVILYFAAVVSADQKIKSLGGRAAIRTGWMPLGIDLIKEALSSGKTHDTVKFWWNGFARYAKVSNSYTFEANLGGDRVIFTADPENIKAVLATQFPDFGKGADFNRDWHEFLGDSVFSSDGQVWHDSRQLIRPLFIKDRVTDLNIFEEHTQQVLNIMKGGGNVVDVKDLFFRFTLDTAMHFILGRPVGSLTPEHPNYNFARQFAHSFAEIQRIQNEITRLGIFARIYPRGTMRKHLKVLNDFTQPFIDEALKLSPEELEKRTKSDDGYTFLHALANYTRNPVVLRDQLVAILIAGRDTTACTLSFLFYELGRHPEIVADLRKEVLGTVGATASPTYNDLKGMKLLQHCLNETLRLYPIVPENMRISLKDTTLPRGGGPDGTEPVGVPEGTAVAYSPHMMHLTQEIYPPTSDAFPAPEDFAPRRWETWQPRHWSYIPFNGGPRICVGQNFALTEMGYLLVRVLQRFERIELRSPATRAGYDSPETAKIRASNPFVRLGAGPSLAERAVESRIPMKAEIVLQPAQAVDVAFS